MSLSSRDRRQADPVIVAVSVGATDGEWLQTPRTVPEHFYAVG
jgi:hypothetical protein